mmetsp:Transcript_58704/g.165652  ORF Transcript_58704/g.165652 Transcript_58704/m.165652 type:complete len:305 (+) Transcript_58704:261-1175(+)
MSAASPVLRPTASSSAWTQGSSSAPTDWWRAVPSRWASAGKRSRASGRTRGAIVMYGDFTTRPKTSSRASSAIIGATGRYHWRNFSLFIRSRMATESGTASSDLCPSARGPYSWRPRTTAMMGLSALSARRRGFRRHAGPPASSSARYSTPPCAERLTAPRSCASRSSVSRSQSRKPRYCSGWRPSGGARAQIAPTGSPPSWGAGGTWTWSGKRPFRMADALPPLAVSVSEMSWFASTLSAQPPVSTMPSRRRLGSTPCSSSATMLRAVCSNSAWAAAARARWPSTDLQAPRRTASFGKWCERT